MLKKDYDKIKKIKKQQQYIQQKMLDEVVKPKQEYISVNDCDMPLYIKIVLAIGLIFLFLL